MHLQCLFLSFLMRYLEEEINNLKKNNMSNNAKLIKRLINYLIDSLCILILFVLLLRALPFILKMVSFDFVLDVNIILFVVFVFYYIIFEGISGRSLGKYITRTKVVGLNGKRPRFIQILIRTFVRLIFIEVISYLRKRPIGWHDKISNTVVIETT